MLLQAPAERIKNEGPQVLRQMYREGCNYFLLRASREFDSFYGKSGLRSLRSFSKICGLSEHQLGRILKEESLPSTGEYFKARSRLVRRYGEPDIDLRALTETKRERAVRAVLTSLKMQPWSNPGLVDSASPKTIARLCATIDPPDHKVASSSEAYSEWVTCAVRRNGLASPDIADAAGLFLIGREYLDGFYDRLIEAAETHACEDHDRNAQTFLEFTFGIEMVLGSFKTHGYRPARIRLDLQKHAGIACSDKTVDSERFIEELLKPWGLTTDAFLDEDVTPAFLVMESEIVRELALEVLRTDR